MRLICCREADHLRLIKCDEDIPPYAILSHTWGSDDEEVTFHDVLHERYQGKAGYNKIVFCGEQARMDGIHYIWVDTCCIDKTSSSELTEAINSMFCWYRNSSKCYVYMSDVSVSQKGGKRTQGEGDDFFKDSRWFNRGWTLQELLAPFHVEFFSREGNSFGTKETLAPAIHEITGIHVDALCGSPLSGFAIEDRFKWVEHRQTKKPEDKAYCLLGIFDVSMSVIYGEGETRAITRLREQISRPLKFVLDKLPQASMAAYDSHANEDQPRCHPETRISLLNNIQAWVDDTEGRCIFWLKGMAGTGKSTISLTVAESLARQHLLGASFFFKRGESARSHATQFFTTLAAQLMNKRPEILPSIQKSLEVDPTLPDQTFKQQFEKLILEPLSAIRPTTSLTRQRLVIVIDALDECDKQNDIGTMLRVLPRFMSLKGIDMRIFVTSRPELLIRLGFQKMNISAHHDITLHDIPEHLVDHDLHVFFRSELTRIREDRSLRSSWPAQCDVEALVQIARPLFIHASTLCLFISDECLGDPQDLLNEVLQDKGKSHAPRLSRTYGPILNQLLDKENRIDRQQMIRRFQQIVGMIVTLIDPLSKQSIANLLDLSIPDLDGILDHLHSILKVPTNVDSQIRLFHLSFHDFLVDKEQCDASFWIDDQAAHRSTALRCLEAMSQQSGLRKNICNLEYPGVKRTNIKHEIIDRSLPAELRYACRFWVDHVQRSKQRIHDDDIVHGFLEQHLLHWLEAMSLLGEVSRLITLIKILQSQLEGSQSAQCANLLYEAQRFVQANSFNLDTAPLQVYYSALVFTPEKSVLRILFKAETSNAMRQLPKVRSNWTAQIQLLEGHGWYVIAVAYSPDGKQLASASTDGTLRLWDAISGEIRFTFEIGGPLTCGLAFSPDSKQLVSATDKHQVRLWDVDSGEVLQEFQFSGEFVVLNAFVYSPDGKQLAACGKTVVLVWDISSGRVLQAFEDNSSTFSAIAFSPDSRQLASASWDGKVRLWTTSSDEVLRVLNLKIGPVAAMRFSPDGKLQTIVLSDDEVQLWDVGSCKKLQQFTGYPFHSRCIAFSPNDQMLAFVQGVGRQIALLDVSSGKTLQVLDSNSSVNAVAFSPDGKQLATTCDSLVGLWDIDLLKAQTIERFSGRANNILALAFSPDGKQLVSRSELVEHFDRDPVFAFSPDSKQLAIASYTLGFQLWVTPCNVKRDFATGKRRLGKFRQLLSNNPSRLRKRPQTHENHAVSLPPDGRPLTTTQDKRCETARSCDIYLEKRMQVQLCKTSFSKIVFSPDGMRIAMMSPRQKDLRLLDVGSGQISQPFEANSSCIWTAAFSPDGRCLAVATGRYARVIKLWDADSGKLLQIFDDAAVRGHITSVTISPENEQLASVTDGGFVHFWDAASGKLLESREIGVSILEDFSVPDGMLQRSTARDFQELKRCKPGTGSFTTEAGVRASIRGDWVTLGGKDTIWLPPEYRSDSIAGHNDLVAIGCQSGDVIFLKP